MLNISKIIGKFIKNSSQRELDRLKSTVEKINAYEPKIKEMPSESFPAKTAEFKSKKLIKSNPYSAELTVLVSVSMDNLKEFSNVKLSNVNILDKINIETIKERKTKKAIFTS